MLFDKNDSPHNSLPRLVITGTGACIPTVIKKTGDFDTSVFYDEKGRPFTQSTRELITSFTQITGIAERRYLADDLMTSDLATVAAKEAVTNSGINKEELDLILVAHNFGNVHSETKQADAVPSLANRVKKALKINNPNCVAFDIVSGCTGWVQSLILANGFCLGAQAKKCLIIGAESLSRVLDPNDRDSMIFSDGAGACVVELQSQPESGILSSASQSHSIAELDFISLGKSFLPHTDDLSQYLKMKGKKVYEFVLSHVPQAMKECLDKSGVEISQLKKIFFHQANEKMAEGALERFYKLYHIKKAPENVMPMSLQWLGNSSVASIPMLFHLVKQGLMENQELKHGDVIMFASVGAGMNISAVCYRC